MALSVGSVSVDDVGNVTGTGLSRDIFDHRLTAYETATGDDASQGYLQWLAGDSEAIATAVIAALKSDAEVTVNIDTETGGLQSIEGAPTSPPLTDQSLTGSVS